MERSLAGAGASRDENTEVDEPCTAVELRVRGRDEEWLGLVAGVLSLEDDNALNLLGGGRAREGVPAEGNGVASVPDVEDAVKQVSHGGANEMLICTHLNGMLACEP